MNNANNSKELADWALSYRSAVNRFKASEKEANNWRRCFEKASNDALDIQNKLRDQLESLQTQLDTANKRAEVYEKLVKVIEEYAKSGAENEKVIKSIQYEISNCALQERRMNEYEENYWKQKQIEQEYYQKNRKNAHLAEWAQIEWHETSGEHSIETDEGKWYCDDCIPKVWYGWGDEPLPTCPKNPDFFTPEGQLILIAWMTDSEEWIKQLQRSHEGMYPLSPLPKLVPSPTFTDELYNFLKDRGGSYE